MRNAFADGFGHKDIKTYPSEIGRVFHGVYGCDLCSQKCYV